MNISSIRYLMVLILAITIAACGRSAGTNTTSANDADNTARNERDRTEAAKTPVDQNENANDLQISANIRKAILDDDSLSSNAHNVKVITTGGVVTLRGPVKSTQEKAAIEMKAKQIAGVTRVDNMLEVEANP